VRHGATGRDGVESSIPSSIPPRDRIRQGHRGRHQQPVAPAELDDVRSATGDPPSDPGMRSLLRGEQSPGPPWSTAERQIHPGPREAAPAPGHEGDAGRAVWSITARAGGWAAGVDRGAISGHTLPAGGDPRGPQRRSDQRETRRDRGHRQTVDHDADRVAAPHRSHDGQPPAALPSERDPRASGSAPAGSVARTGRLARCWSVVIWPSSHELGGRIPHPGAFRPISHGFHVSLHPSAPGTRHASSPHRGTSPPRGRSAAAAVCPPGAGRAAGHPPRPTGGDGGRPDPAGAARGRCPVREPRGVCPSRSADLDRHRPVHGARRGAGGAGPPGPSRTGEPGPGQRHRSTGRGWRRQKTCGRYGR